MMNNARNGVRILKRCGRTEGYLHSLAGPFSSEDLKFAADTSRATMNDGLRVVIERRGSDLFWTMTDRGEEHGKRYAG